MKKEGMKMALKALSEEMRGMMGDGYKGSLEEKLKPKKMMAVQVAADSKENLKKGLSNAEKLLKAKPMDEDSEEMESEESEESCPKCEGKGCPLCESEESEEESEEEIPSEDELKEMSKEELLALLLKKE